MSLRKLRVVLMCAGAIGALSCADPSSITAPMASVRGGPAANQNASKTGRHASRHNARLLRCEAEPTETAVATIGKSGGRITVGPHVLIIPHDALRDPVTITATAPSDTIALVQFQPEGLVFQRPVSLTMDISACTDRSGRQHSIAYLDDAMNVIEYLRSDNHGSKVTALLEHFSNYAVAW